LIKEASMNQVHASIHGAARAQGYRQEAEIARLLTLAPRRRASRPKIARVLRSLAQRLSAYADRLEPTPPRSPHRVRTAAQRHAH
jgi:hypothetical protein